MGQIVVFPWFLISWLGHSSLQQWQQRQQQNRTCSKIVQCSTYHKDTSSSKMEPLHITLTQWPTSWISNFHANKLEEEVPLHALLGHQTGPPLMSFSGIHKWHFAPNPGEGFGWPALPNNCCLWIQRTGVTKNTWNNWQEVKYYLEICCASKGTHEKIC
jgi:hypothetical protein